MRRLLIGALVAASLGGLGGGTATAVCNPDYRPLCLSDCPTGTPNIKDPTDLSWLIRMCPDGAVTASSAAASSKAGDECETAARCVGYCANQRLYPEAAASWATKFVSCVS